MPKLNQNATRKYLKDRLDRLTREHGVYGYGGSRTEKDYPKPLSVREAEFRIEQASRIVNRWGKIKQRFEEKQRRAKRSMRDACERSIIFGDPKSALKMLDRFEKMKF